MTRPPYVIPTMLDIAKVKPNGYRAASLFCGAGGSSLGYRLCGFKIVYASEFVPAAREVYEANAARGTLIDGRDIRDVDPVAVLNTLKIAPGGLDVLDGSPPCSSFSSAGNREADWGATKKYSDTSQRTDDLFFEYVRFIKAMQPRVFVAENVSGLIRGTAKGTFLKVLAAMKACGYRVEAQLLDAQWLGVPQTRQRLIFIGVRNDLGLDPVFPKPLPYRYSVRDALPWIASTEFSTGGQNQARQPKLSDDEPAHSITAGAKNATHHLVTDRRPAIRIGANDGFGKETWQSLDVPAKTIGASPQTGNGRVGSGDVLLEAEPGKLSEKRKFTIAEVKRICSFPDDFKLDGTYGQQWERLGRAVPPLMMRAIATEVLGVLRAAKR